MPKLLPPLPPVVLVGEDNPRHSDPRFALYPAPDGCAGHRLCCRILQMRRADYLRAFARVNLCAGPWSIAEARAVAAGLWASKDGPSQRRLVLLGAKVCSAFGVPFEPCRVFDRRILVLMHPSGRNTRWEIPGTMSAAREAVAAFAPDVAPLIGELARTSETYA